MIFQIQKLHLALYSGGHIQETAFQHDRIHN